MNRSPAPDPDPYFSGEGKDGKKGTPGEERVRLELFPTEFAIRFAGTAAMILGAFVFVLFGIPVAGMLRHGDEPGGILLTEGWRWDRWVARMATVLSISVAAVLLGWGLARFRPWSRRALLMLGAVAPVSMVAGLAIRTWKPDLKNLDDILTLTCVIVVVLPASVTLCWFACSRRTRAAFSPDYQGLIARTRHVTAGSRLGMLAGLALTLAMFILFWTLMLLFLGILVACGGIRSV